MYLCVYVCMHVKYYIYIYIYICVCVCVCVCVCAEQRSRYSDSLRAGRSGQRILVGTRFLAPFQMGPGTQTSILYNGYRVFPVGKMSGA